MLAKWFFVALLLSPGILHADDVPDCGLYTYSAEIVRVIDGDTVVADIDLGFNTWLHDEHLRLNGIDAPEKGTPDAQTATAVLSERVEGRTVYICTIKMARSEREKRGSFGRYLAVIYEGGANINEWLLSEGYVAPYK